jgi:hypothetical protein
MPKLILAALTALCAIACNSRIEYIKYNPGLCYRIVSIGDGDALQPGEILKLHMKQVYRDSVLSNSADSLPFYQVFDSTQLSIASYDLFGKIRKGDSIIFKASTDSIFKEKFPPFARHGEWMYTHVYVKDILPAGYNYQEDLKNEMRVRKMPVPEEVEN